MLTVLFIASHFLVVIMPNAAELCSGAPACYFPPGHVMVLDRQIKAEYFPFVFLHEYAHSIGVPDADGKANKWVADNFPRVVFPATLKDII